MAELSKERYIEAVEQNSGLLVDAARQGLRETVDGCGGWSVARLVAHTGVVQRQWAYVVRTRAQEASRATLEEVDAGTGVVAWYLAAEEGNEDLESVPSTLIPWFEDATRALVDAFRGASSEDRIWHWSGDNRGIVHFRNQAMEATVHRWDAQHAHGSTTPIDSDVAVDGIEQRFDVLMPAGRQWKEWRKGTGETYHLHRTDGPGEWLVRFDGDDVQVSHEHSKGDIALRGSAEELFLWQWGRIPADRLEVFGDRSLLDRYWQLAPPV